MRPLPSGKGRDGMFHFVVERVAAEGAVAGAECAVDARVKLALMVGVVGRAGVVVGGGGEIGRNGKARQQGFCGRVERGIDGVAWELLTNIFAADELGGGGL